MKELKKKLVLTLSCEDKLYIVECRSLQHIYGSGTTPIGAFDDFLKSLDSVIQHHKKHPKKCYTKHGKKVRNKFLSVYKESP